MNISPHFNHYNSSNEQTLLQELYTEIIYQNGVEVCYIPRTQDNMDYLFGEDTTQSYDSYKKIAMLPMFVDGFDGAEMMSFFGNDFKKSGTFVVSKEKWLEIFPEFSRPREGDLIYMPITNAALEIKYVDLESPFFEKGKKYVYEIKFESYEYSYEDLPSGVDLEDLVDDLEIDDQGENVESFGDNDELENDTDDVINFDPDNPFGVR